MDLVYPVRQGNHNEELRLSLRSLVNLAHDKVVICGFQPPWVRNTLFIPTRQDRGKYHNTHRNMIAAANDPRVSDPFILMNDDFYIMQPQQIETLHKGPLKRSATKGYAATYDLLLLLGITDALCYDGLHVPMLIYKGSLLRAWDQAKHLTVALLRTLYGNLHKVGGRQGNNVKVNAHTTGYEDWPLLSSSDPIPQGLGTYLRSTFPILSPYEA